MAPTIFVTNAVSPYVDGPAGVHGVREQAATALAELGSMFGLAPQVSSDVADFEADRLAGGGVLALFTIGDTPFRDDQKEAIWSAWTAGRLRILAVHSALDSAHTWPEYGRMVGARFDGHPWTQELRVTVRDSAHPSTAHLPSPWLVEDELYLFRELSPHVSVLLEADGSDLDMGAPGARRPECGFPLTWTIEDGAARTFASALGHFPHAWEHPPFLRHLHGGLAWLLG